jgi:nicotinic acid mononucleotide adenylyltransferase
MIPVTLPGTEAAQSVDEPQAPMILLPGAFNPLHAGHSRMAELAAAHYGQPVNFEISITNVDKPMLDFVELADRLSQFPDQRVLLSRAATFAEKALIMPRSIFVVGTDTLRRIGDLRYYGSEVSRRDAAIETIAKQGCRFLVFGRIRSNRFETLSDLDVPTTLRDLCEEVTESTFRADISSTERREQRRSDVNE